MSVGHAQCGKQFYHVQSRVEMWSSMVISCKLVLYSLTTKLKLPGFHETNNFKIDCSLS